MRGSAGYGACQGASAMEPLSLKVMRYCLGYIWNKSNKIRIKLLKYRKVNLKKFNIEINLKIQGALITNLIKKTVHQLD